MDAPIVVLELENRRPCGTTATAGGRVVRYEEFDLPARVSRAIGMGCTGATFGFPEGGPTPVARCEDLGGGTLAAVAVYVPTEGGR